MVIEEGKYYRARNGDIFGPMVDRYKSGAVSEYRWYASKKNDSSKHDIFRENGTSGVVQSDEHDHDLLEEYIDPSKRPKMIDELNYLDFRKGIDKLWKMGRVF